MLATGGKPLVVDEATLCAAAELAAQTTPIATDETGSAGLAGVIDARRHGELAGAERVAVLFTAARRHAGPTAETGATGGPRPADLPADNPADGRGR